MADPPDHAGRARTTLRRLAPVIVVVLVWEVL